jgi:Cu-processing system ATP-binding protein
MSRRPASTPSPAARSRTGSAEKEKGRTIILTSHVMSEIEELADVVVYLLDGRIDFQRPSVTLMDGSGEGTLERAIARMMIRAVA